MDSIEKLDARIAKLEKQGGWRFFIQYLLSPLLILLLGTAINIRIERSRAELQRLAAAQQMIPVLFDDNPDKAFATQRVLARTVDAGLARELDSLVSRYYGAKLAASLAAADTAAASAILVAAQAVGGEAASNVLASVEDATRSSIALATSRSQTAAALERKGIEALLAGGVDEAATAFDEAETAYNGYHQVYELGRLVRQRRDAIANPQQRSEVFREILSRYAYGIPADLQERLRSASSP